MKKNSGPLAGSVALLFSGLKKSVLLLLLFLSGILFFSSCEKEKISPISPVQSVAVCETRGGEVPALPENAGESLKLMSTTMPVITIPVVFHVVYNQTAQNISDAQIQSQIDVLNEDFNALNPDIINIPSVFAPLKGNAQIQFVLAKRDPSGNATNGITRTFTNVLSFSSDGAVCSSASGGHDAWPSTQYLNIWVCNKTGAAGSSSYPWSGLSASDGIIVGYNFVGRTGTFTNNWNYKKGRTVTHETGHWLGLGHIWGDASCGNDMVNDTPPQQSANGGSPAFPHLSGCTGNAPNGDMFMNYMDYTYDATRVMFTQGQVNRMQYYLSIAPRVSLLSSQGAIAPASGSVACTTPTGISSASVTSSGATITWTTSGASSYNIRYKPVSSLTWSNAISATTTFNLTGLTSSTVYEVQVQSACSSASSSAFSASHTFTTSANATATCNAPTGLTVSLITTSSARVSWTGNGAASYTIKFKPGSSATWSSYNTNSAYYDLSGLLSATSYDVQVMSNCGSSTSAWSNPVFFTTKIVRGKKKV